MNLKDKLQLAWDNRTHIADALYNKYIESTEEIKAEAARRKTICESNICGYYDHEGKPETSAVPGKPACRKCHCDIDLKTFCEQCWCSLGDIEPSDRKSMDKALWTEILTKEQSDAIEEAKYRKQFEQPKQ